MRRVRRKRYDAELTAWPETVTRPRPVAVQSRSRFVHSTSTSQAPSDQEQIREPRSAAIAPPAAPALTVVVAEATLFPVK